MGCGVVRYAAVTANLYPKGTSCGARDEEDEAFLRHHYILN
jgi:hypothetical protein